MTDEQAEECATVYSEIFNVKNVPGVVKAFPGVVETLERLSSQGILMSIASSRSHRTLAKLMDELDLSEVYHLSDCCRRCCREETSS